MLINTEALKGLQFAERRKRVLESLVITNFPEPVTSRSDLTREVLLNASKQLFTAALKKENNIVRAASIIDGPMLASTLYTLDDSIAKSTSSACDVSRARFGPEIEVLKSRYNAPVNGIIALRELASIGTSHGSYLRHFSIAQETWNGHVDYSFPDFAKGVILPYIGPADAFVIGVICSRANLVHGGEQKAYKIMFSKNSDMAVQQLIHKVVRPHIARSFGLDVDMPIKPTMNAEEIAAVETAEMKKIWQVYSRAATSFYHRLLGISTNKDVRAYPNFHEMDSKLLDATPEALTAALVSGVISSRALHKVSKARRLGEVPYPYAFLYLGPSEYEAGSGKNLQMFDQFLQYGERLGLSLYADKKRGKITIGKQAYDRLTHLPCPVDMPGSYSQGFFVRARGTEALPRAPAAQ